MCKWCQSCLESLYWSCCEERFCYDEDIAKYCDDDWENGKCYANNIGSIDSLGPITKQPSNNNHLTLDSNRLVLTEIPILAPDIYKVFSRSMIFKDDAEVKKYIENEDSKNELIASKNNYNGHIGKVVSFKKDEEQSMNNEDSEGEDVKFSDFEIMFQDELFGEHKIFKIEEEEEEESEKSPTSPIGGLTLEIEHPNVTDSLPDSLDKKLEKVIDIPSNKQITRVDSSKSMVRANSSRALYLPRTKSNILLSRTDSVHSFTRSNSKSDLMMRRVDSMKNLENKNFKNVLARLPQKSASFLSIPDLLNESEDKKSSSSNIFTISGDFDSLENGEHSQISRMPDTPMITGRNLPKFFAETPVIGEYKADTSLQSIAKSPDVIFPEFDFSMPRYYRKSKAIANITAESSNQASKSLPDLHEASTDKMTKRLAKLGSKLKPLII